jgi:hypothetical protein
MDGNDWVQGPSTYLLRPCYSLLHQRVVVIEVVKCP